MWAHYYSEWLPGCQAWGRQAGRRLIIFTLLLGKLQQGKWGMGVHRYYPRPSAIASWVITLASPLLGWTSEIGAVTYTK